MHPRKMGAQRVATWPVSLAAALVIAAAMVAAPDAGLERQASAATETEGGRTYVVLARTRNGRFEFEPSSLSVETGDRVVWLNVSDFHSTTAYHPDNGKPQRIPQQAPSWDSGIFGLEVRAVSFAYRFPVAGVYDYFCRPHELLGMRGRIVAGAPPALSDPATADLPQLTRITGAARDVYRWEALINGPLWRLVEGSPEEAAELAERLVSAFRSGQDGARALRQQLRGGPAVAQFEQSLKDLASAARIGAFEAALAAADRLRDQLAALR